MNSYLRLINYGINSSYFVLAIKSARKTINTILYVSFVPILFLYFAYSWKKVADIYRNFIVEH